MYTYVCIYIYIYIASVCFCYFDVGERARPRAEGLRPRGRERQLHVEAAHEGGALPARLFLQQDSLLI